MYKLTLRRKLTITSTLMIAFIISNIFISFSIADPLDDFNLKWTCDTDLSAYIVPVSKDIDGDGVHEIFIAGKIEGESGGRVMCIDGSNGDIIWQKDIPGIQSPHCPIAIGDLDNDGDYELVHSKSSYGSGTVARNCEDGSIFWDVSYPARYHQLAIADTDENGYPYVFITSDDISGGDTGRIRKLKGTDGSQVAEHFVWHPCFGGISIADLENDGEYEIILTDRNFGSPDAIGVQCFDEDLNLLWYCDEVQCSSHAASIVDVNDDGILDVVVMHQSTSNGGIYVIDGSTGLKMSGKNNKYLGLTTHCQPSVYDIDKDGNLELITAWDANPKVWDLGSWSLDKTLSIYCSEPPDYANVMGDSDLEIIACSGQGNKVYDSDYDLVYSFPQSVGSLWSFTQDIDDDGLNEILFLVNDNLKAYDTLAGTSSPEIRTDTPYYSERRTAAAEYIQQIGGSSPSNNPPTFWSLSPTNGENDVPIDTLSLSLMIADPDGDNFDWTIETSPDIGSSSGNDENNGRKYCNISELDYSVTYRWFVNATDGQSWKRKSYTFTTEDIPGDNSPTFWDSNPSNGAVDIQINTNSLSIMISDPEGDNFDWTIETSPDIGSSSGNDESNGRKYCSISGLSYSTVYKWFVNATDGENWKHRSYIFLTSSEPSYNPPPSPYVSFNDIDMEPKINNPPLTPSIPIGPTSIEVGVVYEFSSISIDTDDEKLRYKFDWDDGDTSNWTEFVDSNITIIRSHSWKKASNYEIKVIAQDENGAYSNWSLPLKISVAQANLSEEIPLNNFDILDDLIVNQIIIFNASGVLEIESSILSYEWDFGDGSLGNGINPLHSYDKPGEYIVTLIITDDIGTKYSKSIKLNIDAKSQNFNSGQIPIPSILQINSYLAIIIGFIAFILILKREKIKLFYEHYQFNRVRKIDLKIEKIKNF